MSYQRILTIQDISCLGQCSLTVALPILSACGHETCILPSAVLSTHTAGFKGFTVRDLSEDLPAISAHWKQSEMYFDAIYTGYLGSIGQIDDVKNIFRTNAAVGCVNIVDPAMGDNGKLYPAFDVAYANAMKTLCAEADILLPNITEACYLTDTEYRETYDHDYVQGLLEKLSALMGGKGTVVLTGVGYDEETTGVSVYADGVEQYYSHRRISKGCHGTGDVYASAFVGALMKGKSAYDAAKIAADYTLRCIEYTQDDPAHWYGVKFEPVLSELMEMVK